MESVFMARSQCNRLQTPPPPLPHYCPTPTLTTHPNNHISVSPVKTRSTTGDGMAVSGYYGNKTTPPTLWRLEPAVYDGDWREEEGEESSGSSSYYNECWKSTSTVDTRTQGEEEGEKGEGEEEEEREEGGTEDRVDGATGQSTIAKYIERFRRAPPTPRDGRRPDVGVGGNFWWTRPPQGPLGSESHPSLPHSHSTPDRSKSTPDTSATSESTNLEAGEGERYGSHELEEREQQALLRSSSLLEGAPSCPTVGVSSRLHLPKPLPTPPLLPLLPPPPSLIPSGPEEDILYQWRLRRRLEQAHRSTSLLSSRLNNPTIPIFKSRPSGARGAGGNPPVNHLLATPAGTVIINRGEEGGGEGGETGGEGGAHQQLLDQTAPADGSDRRATGTSPVQLRKPLPAKTCHTSSAHPPTNCTPSVASCSSSSSLHWPYQHTPCHCSCLPPHKHTVCEIVPCTVHQPLAGVSRRSKYRGREGRARQTDNLRERREGEGGRERHGEEDRGREKKTRNGRENIDQLREEREKREVVAQEDTPMHSTLPPSALPPPTREETIDGASYVSSAVQPSVRYPSPSLLNHMRRPLQSCDNQRDRYPGDREDGDTEISSTVSETSLSTTPPPDHQTTGSMGRLVNQVVEQHLFHEETPYPETRETSFSTTGTTEDYGGDDMGDPLLSALISRARALQNQLRKIHSHLSACEDT